MTGSRRGRRPNPPRGAFRRLWPVLLLALLSVGLIGGCESRGDNLKVWLNKAKAGKPPKVDPLPEPFVYEPIPYAQTEKRTPFEPVALIAPEIKPLASEITPDFNRERERLEQFALSELSLVGTLDLSDGIVALVQTPEGEVARLVVGNYMGRNFGRIDSIDATGIELREIVKDDTGRWQKRSTSFGYADAGGG